MEGMKRTVEASAAKQFTRREALFAGGVVTVGALASSLLGGCSGAASSSSAKSWDKEADLVVVGAGTGLYTALRAREEGLSVIVLEKGAKPGGSTLYSSSVVWAPANKLMEQNGDKDSKADALAYLAAGSGETYLPDHAEAFVDNVNIALDNVTRLTGVEWVYWAPGIDYRSDLPGGRTIGRSLCPKVEKDQAIAGVLGGALVSSAEKAGVEIMAKTPATQLVTRVSDDGSIEVLGVVAKDGKSEMKIRAKRAVVMSSGGFDWNESMMKTYLRVPALYSWGTPDGTGDGQRMAMKAGCDLSFMNEAWLSPGYKVEYEEARAMGASKLSTAIRDDCKRGVIYVNKHGKRFTNECSNYDSVGRSFCALENGVEPRGWQNLPAFAIADQAAVDTYGLNGGKPGQPGAAFKQYSSIEELAQACGIDAAGLAEELARYNDHARNGSDPDFGRGQDYYGQHYVGGDSNYEGAARTLAPLETGPFWAAEVVPVVLGTMGGMKIAANARVLDTDGNEVKRLFAHGNCAGVGCGGAFYAGGGGTLGPSLAFGEIAAAQLSSLEAWS